ncbi:MAG: hypothetical protein ACFFDN_21495 [Candidatus Hodarchaeota archaeon]
MLKKFTVPSINSGNDLKIQSIDEFEVKEKKAPSIKISKFKKLKVKDSYQPLTKSSFQSLMSLISGKIYNSFNFINSLFDFYSYCDSTHTLSDIISSLDNLVIDAKKSFPDLDIFNTINNIKQKLIGTQQEVCSKRIMLDLQFNMINLGHQILAFGENNAKLYSNSVDSNQEIVKKIDWSLDRIKDNLFSLEKQYISNILTHIMVLIKTSGVVITAYSFIDEDLEGDLIGGFLTAIQSFGLEISKKETPMRKLSYQDFEIEIEDGKYVRIALILQGEPIPLVTQQLSEFCKKFETHFDSILQDFRGDISIFVKETPSLISEIFS